MIARLEPVISEMEREGESIVIVGHQAVLRVIFGCAGGHTAAAGGAGGDARATRQRPASVRLPLTPALAPRPPRRYLMAQPQADIPLISIPLHTVIEVRLLMRLLMRLRGACGTVAQRHSSVAARVHACTSCCTLFAHTPAPPPPACALATPCS